MNLRYQEPLANAMCEKCPMDKNIISSTLMIMLLQFTIPSYEGRKMAFLSVKEGEFIQSIDAQLPYEDEGKVYDLIQQAREISDNAAFMVLYEIVFAPTTVSPITKRQLYEQWREGYHHGLLAPVTEAAEALLAGQNLSDSRVLDLMQIVEEQPHQTNALNIVCEACSDRDGTVEKRYHEIRKQWGD